MEKGTILAGFDALKQICLGMSLEEKLCVLGASTAILIANEAKSSRESERMTDLFTDTLTGTISEMMEKKEASDVCS